MIIDEPLYENSKEATHGMVWSKEINKTFCANSAKHYPRRKAVAYPGMLRGKFVWLATIAIKQHDDGHVCPYCGGNEDPAETINTVEFADYENGRSTKPYIQTDCQCEQCQQWWRIRSNPATAESVVDFYPPRNPLSNIPHL